MTEIGPSVDVSVAPPPTGVKAHGGLTPVVTEATLAPMDDLLRALGAAGAVTEAQARRIAELESREHVPLARELHALLYLGAALILAGVGAAVKDRLDQIGPMTIAGALALGAAACVGWCARTAPPPAPGKVESPYPAFDYLLYLGCGLAGIFFGYLEWKWKLLGSWWDLYLFGSALAAAGLAYRFDNRLVLAVALMNGAAFLGLRATHWLGLGGFYEFGTRLSLSVYGAAAAALGVAVRKGELKPHFEATYIPFGVHLCLAALLVDATRFSDLRYWVLAALCAVLLWWSLGERRFDVFAPALGYLYVATLASFLRAASFHGDLELWAVVFSAAGLIAVLLAARSRFKEASA